MKKTISINLANRNFYIEEDAYRVLDEYIRGIREYYRVDDPEGEIAEDFEIRMGELFSEKLRLGHEVITLALTQEAIQQLGRIEELDEPEEPSGNRKEESGTHTNADEAKEGTPFEGASEQTREETMAGNIRQMLEKKLYRNPRNKILGGVLSGISAYIKVDVSLLRLVFVLFLFTPINWIVVLLYLAAWMFVPQAVTATERLKMEGRPLNSENLWQTISEDNPEVQLRDMELSKEDSSEHKEVKKKKSKNNILWWGLAILLLLIIIATLISLIISIDNGYLLNMTTDNFVGLPSNGWIVWLGLMLGIFVLVLVAIVLLGWVFVIYVLPIRYIMRLKSERGVVKVILIVAWIALVSSWPFFL